MQMVDHLELRLNIDIRILKGVTVWSTSSLLGARVCVHIGATMHRVGVGFGAIGYDSGHSSDIALVYYCISELFSQTLERQIRRTALSAVI